MSCGNKERNTSLNLISDHPFGHRVTAVFTTRTGGVSKSPYASLNLGLHVGDDESKVIENRTLVETRLAVPCVYMQQTHSSIVKRVWAPTSAAIEADALVTTCPRLGLAVMTADCLPLLLSSKQGSVVAAVHCGWRGIYGDIIDHTVMLMRELTEEPLIAWQGPAIGPESFEVGSEVYAAFVEKHAEAQNCFVKKTSQKYLASLYALCSLELKLLNVTCITEVRADTFQQNELFFSYRRDKITGRMAGIIFKN